MVGSGDILMKVLLTGRKQILGRLCGQPQTPAESGANCSCYTEPGAWGGPPAVNRKGTFPWGEFREELVGGTAGISIILSIALGGSWADIVVLERNVWV